MDSQTRVETLRRRKREREMSAVTTSATTSNQNDTIVIVQLEDDEHETTPKTRRTEFMAPLDKGGHAILYLDSRLQRATCSWNKTHPTTNKTLP